MIFSTPAFLFLFLPPILLTALFLKKEAQNFFLLLASLVFYAWGEGALFLLLLTSALLNHCFGLAVAAGRSPRQKKRILVTALIFNLGLLAFYKYAAFFAGSLNPLLGILNIPALRIVPRHMPLGISFFTFMAMAYLIDVYNQFCPAEKNFLHTVLFITFFPTVLAGPINRYSRLRLQMSERQATPELLASGIRRFIIGLGKKALLADALAKTVDQIFAITASDLTAGLAWLGAACYTLQIFLDFSGYSDMAIGLGQMFGFQFMENFNYPYLAKSIKDFWNRWHISLSSWLRDYIFLPLAYAISRRITSNRLLGIRAESWSYYPSMLITMLLCGLWHGAAWTFIAWGIYHGVFIMLERFALARLLKRLWLPLQTVYSLLIITCGWVLFRAGDFSQAAGFVQAMFGFGGGNGKAFYPASYLNNKVFFVLGISFLSIFSFMPALKEAAAKLCLKTAKSLHPWLRAGYRLVTIVFLTAVLLTSAMALAMATYNPFIYFRF